MAKGKPQGFVSAKGDSPAVVAARLLEEERYLTDQSDTVYRHNGRHWEPLSRATLRQIALQADGYKKSSDSRRKEIIEQIKARSHIKELAWGRVADWEVACKNGVVDVRNGGLRPHRPEDYLEKVIPWEYQPGAPAAAWGKALRDWFPEERGEIVALQEFSGYVTMSHAKYKKAAALVGPSDTGKSVIIFALQHLVGTGQCCSLPIHQMDDPIARAVVVGKSLNVLTEIPVEAVIGDGGFKQLISTEEPVLINEKYKPAFMYVPTAKHVFATNALPRMNDRSEGVINRLLIIPTRRVLARDEQDERLRERLIEEMPGILLWAIEGAKRLVDRHGQFPEVAAGAELLQELRTDANPAIDFIRERLVPDTESALPLARLVEVFNAWNKGSRKTTTKGLGKMLRAAHQAVKDVRVARTPDRVGKVSVVLKSLVGFRIDDEPLPERLKVEADSAASASAEIEANVPPDAPV